MMNSNLRTMQIGIIIFLWIITALTHGFDMNALIGIMLVNIYIEIVME